MKLASEAEAEQKGMKAVQRTSLLGDHSEREPPDPIPNSEVKPLSADDSAAVCRAKVGNRQAFNHKPKASKPWVFFAQILAY